MPAIAQVTEIKGNPADQALPDWARMMYAAHPDVKSVINAYEKYYETHPFVKDRHTQYFKRWVREMERNPYTTEPGKPLSAYDETQTQRYLQRVQTARQQRNAATAAVAGWQSIGPITFDKDAAGRSYAAGAAHVYTVEQSLSNTNVLYAGTATAGLYKSTDKGLNWSPLTNSMMITGIGAVEIDQLDHNIVYFGGGGKIYKSTNGGNNFFLTGDAAFNSATYGVNDIVSRPGFRNTLFLATDKGLYRSTDGGANYTLVQSGNYQEVEFKPGNNTVVYAVKQLDNRTEFYKSTDGGNTFSIKSAGWPAPAAGEEQKRTEIAVTPADPDIVYALATGAANGGSGLYGIYMSNDAGESWTFKCCGAGPGGAPSPTNLNLMGWSDIGQDDGGQYYYDLALDVNPTNANDLQVGAVNRWVSSDGGVNFTCPAKWSHSDKVNYVHADIHDIRFYGNDLWIACDGGIFYSSNNGASFQVRMKGISGTEFWGFGAGFWEGNNVMVGGTYHNGTLLKDNNTYIDGWLSTDGGDNIFGAVAYANDRIAYSDYGKKLLSGSRTVAPSGLPNGRLPNRHYWVGHSSDLIYDAQQYNTIYLGEGTQLWKSVDGSINYTSMYNFNEKVGHIAVGYKNASFLYAATLGPARKLWRSTNGGSSWTEITPTGLSSNSLPYYVVVSSDNPNHIWIARVGGAADGQQVYKSENGGASWTSLSTPTLNGEQLTCMVYQRGTNGGVYIGTRRAVYYRNNTMSDWALFNQGLPVQTYANRLHIDYKDARLINATSRSVWATPLYENAPPEALISVDHNTLKAGETARFYNHSAVRNSNVTYAWSFPGGSPATSTLRHPSVVYNQPGTYNVQLVVTNSDGSSTRLNNNFITVTSTCITGGAVPARSQWSIKYVSSEETTGEGSNNGRAIHAIDGNTGTFWHSQWYAASPAHPHEIQINLGACATIGAIGYLPRQDAATNGTITGYELYTSQDGITWNNAATGAWIPTGKTERVTSFTSRNAQYVRLRTTAAAGNSIFASAAEINVYSAAPVIAMTDPKTDQQQTAGCVTLYPNPARAQINVVLKGEKTLPIRYRIYDAQGQQKQFGWLLNNTNSVSISTLPPGVYFITIGEGDSKETLRFVVQP